MHEQGDTRILYYLGWDISLGKIKKCTLKQQENLLPAEF